MGLECFTETMDRGGRGVEALIPYLVLTRPECCCLRLKNRFILFYSVSYGESAAWCHILGLGWDDKR